MTNQIAIYDHLIGEQIVRDMTVEENAEREAEIAAYLETKTQREIEAEELRTNKISAYQKLGLTEAEIEALLPKPKPVER